MVMCVTGGRRSAMWRVVDTVAVAGVVAVAIQEPREARAAGSNPAIVAALKTRSSDMRRAPAQLIGKLRSAQDMVRVAERYAEDGEYGAAREQLRSGALGKLRLTVQEASDLVVFERPNFDEYEREAVNASLGALDRALRERANGAGSDADVASDARLLLAAIDSVVEDMEKKAAAR